MKKKNFAFTVLLFFFFNFATQSTAFAQLGYAKAEQIIDEKFDDWKNGWLCMVCYVKGSADVEDIIKTGSSEYLVKGTIKYDIGSKRYLFKARFRITGSGNVKILKLCYAFPSEELDWSCKTYY